MVVKVAKTAAEFSKLIESGALDFGPEIYGNIDVPGPLLASMLDLDERTIREYATKGIVIRSPVHKGMYRYEASVHAYLNHLKNAAFFRKMGTLGSGPFGRGEGVEGPVKVVSIDINNHQSIG